MPTKENYTQMTPTEFEQYTLSVLKRQFEDEPISDFSFTHNVKKEAHDGTYQIDGEIRFTIMGVEIITLVECKQYKDPIKREAIQTLYSKIQSLGAHKGIFVTTSHFQSGAILYAKEHGIALISIIDGKERYETRGADPNDIIIPSWIEYEPYCMGMQTLITDTSISVSFIDKTDALFQFIIANRGD